MDDRFIRVSDYVKKRLEEIKRIEQHKSMDSVLRRLLQVYEVAVK